MVTWMDLSTDEHVQQDVLQELHFDPEVRPTDVGVEVDHGIVALTGTVDSYHKKCRAAEIALRVRRVRGVANELTVQLPSDDELDDAEIANTIANALEHSVEIPQGRIKVTVEAGRVTLSGSVDWYYQRKAAHEVARRIRGVKH